jgi:hypothetical protein
MFDEPYCATHSASDVQERQRPSRQITMHPPLRLPRLGAVVRGNEAAEPSALDGCTQLALAGGAFLARPGRSPNDTSDADLDRGE